MPDNRPDIDIGGVVIDWSDWNGRLRSLVEALVGMIPEVGNIIDLFLIVFWPDVKKKQPDIWSQIQK